MKAAIVVLAVLGWATSALLPDWHDDRALWRQAWAVAPSARAALNLAVDALRQRDTQEALLWDEAAMRYADGDPVVPRLVRQHLLWIEVVDSSWRPCTVPPWASWC